MEELLARLRPFVKICRNVAKEENQDYLLLLALICQESSARVGAIRFERNYKWLYEPAKHATILGITLETEEMAQKFSYGLTQIMLATARWCGFIGYPYELYEPVGNITWCARYLSQLQKKHSFPDDIISAYNAGSPRKDQFGKYFNHSYVESVNRYKRIIQANGILNA